MMQSSKARWRPEIWVPLVLAIGTAVGFGLSLLPSPVGGTPPGGGPFPRTEVMRDFDIVLSSIAVALLVALFLTYLKVYSDTKANFALGLLVVLGTLLFQAVLVFPALLGLVGLRGPEGFPVLPFADALRIIAFSVFLYLSLE